MRGIGNGRGDRSEVEAIKAAHDIVDVAGRYTKMRRAGRHWVGLSPLKAEKTPSFVVYPHNQSWFCYATREGGDVIRLVAMAEACDDGEAIRRLKADAGLGEAHDPGREARVKRLADERARKIAKAEAEDAARRERMSQHAAGVVRAARPAHGTLVERYLRHRGIDLDALADLYGWPGGVPPSLRFVPALDYRHGGRVIHSGPAMIGLIARAPDGPGDGHDRGVHRTWLSADGVTGDKGKARIVHGTDKLPAKLTLGDVWGSAGWIAWGEADMIVGEGYETTLTVLGTLARSGRRVTAASALALGNLSGGGIGRGTLHPEREGVVLPSRRFDPRRPGMSPPAGVARITILADADGDGPSTEALVERAASRWRAAGFAVRVAWPERGSDFNDMAMRAATVAGDRP